MASASTIVPVRYVSSKDDYKKLPNVLSDATMAIDADPFKNPEVG